MLPEIIKALRKRAQISQEQLAEKLHVSRQAVTKWETGAGVPDVENLRALAALFQVSLDELLGDGASAAPKSDFLFNSVTTYDIDCEKSYDITFAGAKQVTVWGYEGEKLVVQLASNQLEDIQSAFKVKIDDVKKKIDVEVRRFGDMTEAVAKEALHLLIRLPRAYCKWVELAGNAKTLELWDLAAENMEFTGHVGQVRLGGVAGHVELNVNQDMEILCRDLPGRLDINQVAATSRLSLPIGTAFLAVTRGIANHIYYQKDGERAGDFSAQGEAAEACGNVVELNGLRSELVINACSAPAAGCRQ